MSPGDFALDLPHIYFYVIPLGLAECHHALGDYAAAETKYLEAAGYQYLNAAVEAPYLWSRLATLYLDWGNSFFRDDDAASALPYYERVIMSDDSVPAATLYQLAALKPGADVARVVLSALDHVSDINVDPAIATSRGYLPAQEPSQWPLMANQRSILLKAHELIQLDVGTLVGEHKVGFAQLCAADGSSALGNNSS